MIEIENNFSLPDNAIKYSLIEYEEKSNLGLSPEMGGRPTIIFNEKPYLLDEFNKKKASLKPPEGNWDYTPEEIEDVRRKLQELQIYGHSITVDEDTESSFVKERAVFNMLHTVVFGLWPRTLPYRDKMPYLGEFGIHGNQLAGDHFKGFALVTTTDHDQIVINDDGSYFIPSSEFCFIVPTEDIKSFLIQVIKDTPFLSQKKLKEMNLWSRIKTFEDVLSAEDASSLLPNNNS